MPRSTTPKPIRLADDTGIPSSDAPTLIPIPEGKSGDFDLIHKVLPAGGRLQYFDTGVSWPTDRTFTILRQNGDVWMSDTPQETAAMSCAAKAARGEVLVTGLGLGVFHRCLPDKVETCTTVESNNDVIQLVWRHLAKADHRHRLVRGDAAMILAQMQKAGRTFDFIYLDTWDRGDYEQLPTINWYVRLAQQLLAPKGVVRAWMYEKMVRSYCRDNKDLVDQVPFSIFQDPEKREGMRKRWPLSATFIDWFCDEKKGQATAAEIKTWSQQFIRTVVTPPEHCYKLTDQRVATQEARELGLVR
jgi:spermidine synthase